MSFDTRHRNSVSSTLDETIKQFEYRQSIYSFLGLLILIGASIIANNLHLQSVAEQSTKYVTRMIQMGQMREVTFVLEEALNTNFKSITYKSKNPGRTFTMPPALVLIKHQIPWHTLLQDKVIVPVNNPLSKQDEEIIIYEYNRFSLVPYAIMLWFFILLVTVPQTRLVKRRLIEQFEKDLVIEKSKAHASISDEVRHNLRTPLASLMRLPARLPETMSQDKELLKTSIEQIRRITAALDYKKINKTTDQNLSDSIYNTLYKSINQIRRALPSNITFNAQIDDSLCSTMVSHIPVELQIIIGNIVNNSIDALKGSPGAILFRAKDLAPDLILEIEDNGPGINPNILNHIFEQGFTSGKTTGSGLGLYHAYNWITQWGGKINASSEPNNKTILTIQLPIDDRESWYVPRLKFNSNEKIFILDDQITVRQLWKIKLAEYDLSSCVYLLSNITEAKVILSDPELDINRSTFLFDYDLKESETGLDLLNLLPKQARRYLVTGHFDKTEIHDACKKNSIYLIPKSEIAELPIIVV